MNGSQAAFEDLLLRARAGDRAAMGELYAQYSEPVRRVVRRRLNPLLRRRYDSCDFVQSVWTSFVQLELTDQAFATPDDFVAYLAAMAANKIAETTRQRMGSLKNDIRREMSLTVALGEASPLTKRFLSPAPSPSQYVMAKECWQQLIAGQPEGHVRVLELLRDGHSVAEISERLNLHVKVIRRLRNRLQDYLERP